MNCLYLEASVAPAAAAAAVVIVVVVVVAAAVVVAVAVAVAAAVVADYLQRRVRCLDSLRFQPFFTRIFASSKSTFNTNYGIFMFDVTVEGSVVVLRCVEASNKINCSYSRSNSRFHSST